MTDSSLQYSARATSGDRVAERLRRRHRADRRFRIYGVAAVILALFFLASLFASVVTKAYTILGQTEVALNIHFDEAFIDKTAPREGNYGALIKAALADLMPEVRGRRDKRAMRKLVSSGAAFELQAMVEEDRDLIGQKRLVWLPAADDVDMWVKGQDSGRISDKQAVWLNKLDAKGRLERHFNWRFFTSGDSREPELAGIFGAAAGSFFTLLICLILAFPIGVMSAIYLEEFAPKNRFTDFIEVNINNLAAVPSIVFGLLGLAVLLNFAGMPRSAPLVGGIVLALMTFPTVIIAGRAALGAVPPSIREAALGVGASPQQVVFHHVLPLAMPGILTGVIVGMARALGETAPLLMIGMVAFIVDIPSGPLQPATALPVQVFLWADAPERAFGERAAAAILVLLAFLIVMNLAAVLLRRRFEIRW